MFRHLTFGLFGLLVVAATSFGQRGAFFSPGNADRVGLDSAWTAQIKVDVQRGGLGGLHLHASKKRTYGVVEVRYDKAKKGDQLGVVRYSELDYSRRKGGVIGLEDATRLGEHRVRELKQLGRNPVMEVKQVPVVTLYATSSQGGVQAFDAETGRTIWTTQIGNRQYPTGAPAANDEFVAAVNGSYLHLLERETGRLIKRQKLSTSAGGGPAMSDSWVFVPLHNGRLEGFSLTDEKRRPWYYQSNGRTMVQPTISGNMISWGTTNGYMYMADLIDPKVRFRIQTNDTIGAPSSFLEPNYLFTTSADGYVYAVHERLGDLLWTYSVGEPISSQPLCFDKSLIVATDRGSLVSINPETGEELWRGLGAKKILAAGEDRVYILSDSGRLVVINSADGSVIGAVPTPDFDRAITNVTTDRIYLATSSGVLQCLRQADSGVPIVRIPKGATAEGTTDDATDDGSDSGEDTGEIDGGDGLDGLGDEGLGDDGLDGGLDAGDDDDGDIFDFGDEGDDLGMDDGGADMPDDGGDEIFDLDDL